MSAVIASDTTICRDTTLKSFADELPPGTDLLDFAKTRDPLGKADQLADRCTRADQSNDFLKQAILFVVMCVGALSTTPTAISPSLQPRRPP